MHFAPELAVPDMKLRVPRVEMEERCVVDRDGTVAAVEVEARAVTTDGP